MAKNLESYCRSFSERLPLCAHCDNARAVKLAKAVYYTPAQLAVSVVLGVTPSELSTRISFASWASFAPLLVIRLPAKSRRLWLCQWCLDFKGKHLRLPTLKEDCGSPLYGQDDVYAAQR